MIINSNFLIQLSVINKLINKKQDLKSYKLKFKQNADISLICLLQCCCSWWKMNEKICSESLKYDIKSYTKQHHNKIFNAVHIDSKSLSFDLNLKWELRVLTIITELYILTSTTFKFIIIISATVMRPTSYIINVEARKNTLFVLN